MLKTVLFALRQVLFGSLMMGLFINVADAAPILVTRISGEAQIQKGGELLPSPNNAFPLLDGEQLILASGATAVVLANGKAQQVIGPVTFSTQSQIGSSDAHQEKGVLDDILARQSSTAPVGATRSDPNSLQFVQPVPNTQIQELTDIQWICRKCGTQNVEVVELPSLTPIWTGTGDDIIAYKGKKLSSGEYALRVNGAYTYFIVAPKEYVTQVEAAIALAEKSSKDLPVLDQVAIQAGIWWNASMPTEALQVLDAAVKKNPNDKDLYALQQVYYRLSRAQ